MLNKTPLTDVCRKAYNELKAGFLLLPFIIWSKISNCLPNEDDLWVFGPSRNGWFFDNSKYLFLYASNNTDKRCVWISKSLDEKTIEKLSNRGYEVYDSGGIMSKYLILRAEFVFISYRVDQRLNWFVTGSKVVQLWHGNPIKRLSTPGRPWTNYLSYLFENFAYENWSYFLVTADGYPSQIFQDVFSIPEENIVTCGYPRNDILQHQLSDGKIGNQSSLYKWADDTTSNIIVYLPTWRSDNQSPKDRIFSAHNFPIEPITDILDTTDSYLLVKPHPRTEVPAKINKTDRIRILPNNLDIYPVLSKTDILVTDYSSVLFDFLIVDKPIILYPFDYDKYEQQRGFYYDYYTDLPGRVAETSREFINTLEETLNGDDKNHEQRHRVNNQLNPTCGKLASECIISKITED